MSNSNKQSTETNIPLPSSASSSPSFKSCTILWSTQSGRAKACARRTARLIRSRCGVTPTLDNHAEDDERVSFSNGCSFDEYGVKNLFKLGNNGSSKKKNKKKLLVMFVSTTGDGEHCDSIRDTWNALLQKSLAPITTLQNLYFTLFALGDRAYGPSAFCAAGRKLAARLIQLGATPFNDVSIGYGDDGTPNGGVFADLDVWLEKDFLPALGAADGDGDEMEDGMDQEVLYQVCTLEEEDHTNDAKSDANEWQTKKYQTHYNHFFATLCPATSYQYDKSSGMRIDTPPGTDDNNNYDDDDDDAKEMQDEKSSSSWRIPLIGHVVSNKRMTDSDWEQDTRYLRIAVLSSSSSSSSTSNSPPPPISNTNTNHHHPSKSSQQQLPYQAGDVATILPSNTPESVSRFLSVLPTSIQSMADTPIQITRQKTFSNQITKWPKQCTLRGLLTHCADINSLPEREDLRALSRYCCANHAMGRDQQSKLISLSETKDAALYGDYIIREKRSWVDVLFDFDSIRYVDGDESSASSLLTVEHLLMILPPIMPRHFSIASAPSMALLSPPPQEEEDKSSNSFEIELCVALVQGNTPLGRSYQGLCSGYLSRLLPEQQQHYSPSLRLWIKPGSFGKLPLQALSSSSSLFVEHYFETPIMCIGAGTGIAPLRSLVMEREARRTLALGNNTAATADGSTPLLSKNMQGETNNNNNNTSSSFQKRDNILVFGCRKKSADYYFQNDWETLEQSKRLRLLTAFSRDQWYKIYVQRVVKEADNGLLIVRHLLEDSGAVYIAGGAKMARCVKDEIMESLSGTLARGERDAKVLLKRLGKMGKFNVEAWS